MWPARRGDQLEGTGSLQAGPLTGSCTQGTRVGSGSPDSSPEQTRAGGADLQVGAGIIAVPVPHGDPQTQGNPGSGTSVVVVKPQLFLNGHQWDQSPLGFGCLCT